MWAYRKGLPPSRNYLQIWVRVGPEGSNGADLETGGPVNKQSGSHRLKAPVFT